MTNQIAEEIIVQCTPYNFSIFHLIFPPLQLLFADLCTLNDIVNLFFVNLFRCCLFAILLREYQNTLSTDILTVKKTLLIAIWVYFMINIIFLGYFMLVQPVEQPA